MKLLEVKTLAIPEIKVIKFGRFPDHRGYFTEHFRKSDFQNNPELDFMKGIEFFQANESYSKAGTMRGLHFQWNPYMGKLVRTLHGRMIDLVLDIRKGSPTEGKIIAYDLPVDHDKDFSEWIWVPKGFAHGNIFTEDSMIEYFCSGEYNPNCEAGLSPLAKDLDFSLFDSELKKVYDEVTTGELLISDKDRDAFSFEEWMKDERADNFKYVES